MPVPVMDRDRLATYWAELDVVDTLARLRGRHGRVVRLLGPVILTLLVGGVVLPQPAAVDFPAVPVGLAPTGNAGRCRCSAAIW